MYLLMHPFFVVIKYEDVYLVWLFIYVYLLEISMIPVFLNSGICYLRQDLSMFDVI